MKTRVVTKAGRGIARFGVAALTALCLLGTVGVASADPLLQEDFKTPPAGMRGGEIVTGPEGAAWRGPGGNSETVKAYVEYPVSRLALNPTQGTIEFDVTRNETYRNETMFSLMDKSGERLFSFRITWNGRNGQPEIGQFFKNKVDKEYWYVLERGEYNYNWPRIPVGAVGKGRKIHVALTWTSGGGDIFVDGRSLGTKINPRSSFSELVAATATILVGAETDRRNPKGAWSISHSLIGNFQVHDRALAAAELAQPIVDKAPAIAAVSHNANRVAGFSGKLVAGDKIEVTVAGTPGAQGTFGLAHFPDVRSTLTLDWRGWGVYLEDKVFYEEGEVNLRDVEGYLVYASTAPFDPAAPGMEPVAELEVGVQSYLFELPEVDRPYYLAAVARMRDGTTRTVISPIEKLPLTEAAPGVYTGSYQAGWQDRYPRAVLVARLENAGIATTFVDTNPLVIDSSLTIAVTAEPSELKADETSKAKVVVTVTNANGNPVPGHKLKFLLATTSQYTGVVGGGDFADQVGGKISEDRWLETDLFGKAEVMYVAGFAAKTAIIVARDMLSNSTGSGWVKTFITATAQLELEPVIESAAMDRGFEITVTSSDEWLTADGKSQARITARVTLGGEPVEGHKVGFSVSPGAGSIRSVVDTTNRNGEARAVYTAGKKIGIALITATDTTAGISGTVSIELRSDAPAKIVIKIEPDKLPADGRSRAELSVLVTDINDNPNDNTEVEYLISSGSGSLRDQNGLTDRRGESATQYTAGRSAGTVTFDMTVRSLTPTEAELAKARDLAVAVTDHKFF